MTTTTLPRSYRLGPAARPCQADIRAALRDAGVPLSGPALRAALAARNDRLGLLDYGENTVKAALFGLKSAGAVRYDRRAGGYAPGDATGDD